jgi:hypothetical protein
VSVLNIQVLGVCAVFATLVKNYWVLGGSWQVVGLEELETKLFANEALVVGVCIGECEFSLFKGCDLMDTGRADGDNFYSVTGECEGASLGEVAVINGLVNVSGKYCHSAVKVVGIVCREE